MTFISRILTFLLFVASGVRGNIGSQFSNSNIHRFRSTDRRFGITSDAILNLRGGDVLEPKTSDELSTILAENSVVVIDFSATWCGPCKMIAPFYEELSNAFPGLAFVKIDVDESADIAASYGVSAMPTFIFLKDGEVVDKIMGANPQKLKEFCEEMS
mmetsp:Transcript_12428/g.15555  ORF Transcript_12428/g.15555 Transcript_12428/m.15555 type:complete len:158 (-) Transcript_12428:224-697(-)|eukprot:CAMPEP_0172517912 /NCGR_PEP_ID=MMETSP1066-20121228/288901_1 /TAXON_ID=671091 /ORGANISM="Coscinodiscus wailesii, Strain CCMP2513" /LENGTH=157 /DNA_ID=CAMNT_0013300125 /DNA_START=84 /DNA_END=557 /DNA_ORIENTATION=+